MSTVTSALDTGAFNYICNLVRDRSAIVLEPSKAYLVESRLTPVARQHGMETLTELVEALKKPTSRELTQQVVEAMTTNETSFFRDVHPFDALKQVIIPKLLETRARERAINIWSNACSSGQEVYTIAMIIRENFPELSSWRVKLFGSDLSKQILSRAKEGIYNQTEINRGLPLPLLLKYFDKQGMQWRIKEDLRKMVEFRELNLVEPWPTLQPMDVIFLRNVLIYFSPETKRQILTKTHKALRPDGFLFLGGAETTMNLDVPFNRENVGKTACYRPIV